jgi:hypothetical protein
MTPKQVFVALLLGLTAILPLQAHADVLYTVFNPAAPPFPFTLFIYEAPGFITSDTTVSAVQLNFANPKNTITSVAFLPDSITHPGMSELDVFQSSAPLEQVRYYPLGTFDAVGVTAGLPGSQGYPNSKLGVAVPEPFSSGLLGVGGIGLLWLRYRRRAGVPQPVFRSGSACAMRPSGLMQLAGGTLLVS